MQKNILSIKQVREIANDSHLYNFDYNIVKACQSIISQMQYENEMLKFNNELSNLLQIIDSINDPNLSTWCLKSKSLFEEQTKTFVTEFLFNDLNENGLIYLGSDSCFVKEEDIAELFKFSFAQSILYYGEYYLPKDKRCVESYNLGQANLGSSDYFDSYNYEQLQSLYCKKS